MAQMKPSQNQPMRRAVVRMQVIKTMPIEIGNQDQGAETVGRFIDNMLAEAASEGDHVSKIVLDLNPKDERPEADFE